MNATSRQATIIGTGLIGGSIGLALRKRGWHVTGYDAVPGLVDRAIALGACDDSGVDPGSELVVVATPVEHIVPAVLEALRACPHAAVTDVGGVKGAIVSQIDDPRFVGGHPMAGSERLGLEGAHADLFEGAAWALCPDGTTSDDCFVRVRSVVTSLGAEALTLEARLHDELVAVVSHVPHLTAAALVRVAHERSSDHTALLRLAAGGFRDMTRIAAGSPTIWPSVCAQNRAAILATLDRLVDELGALRSLVDEQATDELLAALGEAQAVRRNLPNRPAEGEPISEVRVLIADRPGSVESVARLATEMGINLASVSTIDVSESVGGVLVLSVREADAERLCAGLVEAGHRAFVQTDVDT